MNAMNFARASAKTGLLALAVFFSSLAAADDSGWYIGANVGPANAEIDDERIIAALLGGGFTTTSIRDDKESFGYKLLGGYKFNRHFALEGGYFDMDEFGFEATTSPAGTLTGTMQLSGFNIDPVAIWPITQKFSAYGRAGATYATATSAFTGTGTVSPPADKEKSALNYKYGAGLQYDFTPSLGLRAEAERYRIDDAVGNKGDVDHLSLRLAYFFHATKRHPLASRAAAEPILVVVPVVAKDQKYCSILDIQFEINKDDIQREEKEKLGVVGTFMRKYPDTTAVIEGHTDNIGTPEDNMALSQRRAESVVAYQVDTLHIASSRLRAVGYGDTRPLADNATEEGKRLNRRIGAVIACAKDIPGLAVKPARITMAMEMEFDRNKADVKPEYRDEMLKVANFLKANPTVTATVEGHTANLQGTPEEGMELSQRRAESVVNALVDDFGIDRSRLSAEGFGTTRRFAYNTSLEGQQENRRVNIIINYPGMGAPQDVGARQ